MRQRLLLAPLLALSLAAAPAQAERRDDAARMRGLALTVAAVAAVALAVRAAGRDDGDDGEREVWRDDARPEPLDSPPRRLPAACLRPFDAPEGPRWLLEPDCLDASVAEARDIPLACAVTLRTPIRAGRDGAGFATGFDPDCMARRGWRTD